jgi:CRISPR system Cascade subunit CasE
MTALHLIRLPIALPALHRWAGERGIGWAGRRGPLGRESSAAFDEGCALHHLLAESFGKAVLQPFRLMPAPGHERANLYAYSLSDRAALIETLEACAMPEALAICDPVKLEAKPMPENWREGRRLGFEARVRPVRRLIKACGSFSQGAEIDAFLVHVLRQYPDGAPQEGEEQQRREEIYKEWLAERLGDAAKLDSARLVRFLRHRAVRKDRVLEGPDATLQGDFIIRDPVKFTELLARGIGRHTAYGFGMLLIRPPGGR